MTTLSATEARAALPRLLDRVEAGEEIVLTRHGREVAVIVRPDALRSRRAAPALDAASALADRLDAARAATRPRRGISAERADALVAEVERSRDGR